MGIHPTPRSAATKARKAANHRANLEARRNTNQERSHDPVGKPTWHGIGRHAQVPVGH